MSYYITESNLLHMEPSRMNFFQFQNLKSEAERYFTGSLHTQLEVWNTAIALFVVQAYLPKFQSQPQTRASKWSHRTGRGETCTESPSWL